jgi:hypothetical protein
MDRNFVVLFVVVNVLILALGGFLAYSDLYLRKDTSRTHENTTLIGVEYSPLAYRPTYEYMETTRDGEPLFEVVAEGSLTLGFFQLSIIAVIISLAWFLTTRRKSNQKTTIPY